MGVVADKAGVYLGQEPFLHPVEDTSDGVNGPFGEADRVLCACLRGQKQQDGREYEADSFHTVKVGINAQSAKLSVRRALARALIDMEPSCRNAGRFFDNFKNTITMIRPLGTRVVVEPKEAETMTAGGLYIPDNAKEKPQQGTVVAVGPGSADEAMEVAIGDTVLYGKYAGTEVTVDTKKYLIVKQADILAIL